MQYLQKFRELINANVSGTLQALRLDITSLLQGTTARTCIPEEPIQLAQDNPAKLFARLNGQPAYLLFNRTIYHVHFRNNTPIVQRCIFQDPLPERFEEILAYFPAESDALACDINQELEDITSIIEPVRICYPAGTTARSCVPHEPFQFAEDNPAWFAARLNHRPAYLLFKETIYHVHFEEHTPIVQHCTFKHPRSEHFAKVLTYFPKTNEPLKNSIDDELEAIIACVVPNSAGFPEFKIKSLSFNVPAFNSTLLRHHFAQPINPQNPDLPLIEFSKMGLLAIEDDFDLTTLRNEAFIPTLVYKQKTKEHALYGYHKQWRLTPMNSKLIKSLGFVFTRRLAEVGYDVQFTELYLHIIEKKAHIHYDTLPNQVSQMRKILAGIYFLKETFFKLEHSVSSISQALNGLFEAVFASGDIHDSAHQGITLLLSDLDIDLSERFANQILELSFLLERFQDYSEWVPRSDIKPNDKAPWTYYMGHLMGFATKHIHSKEGELDFETLSQLAANMPKHLDLITTWMNQQTDNINQYAPNINEKELKALQKEANKLLAALKTHHTTQLSALQIINYIYLIRQVIILLTSNIQQVGHLHTAYQELLFTYLNITKEQLFPKLFAIIDKIEIEFIIDPCSLSQPYMQWITNQFEFITAYIQPLANFNFQPELLRLEDARFMKYRRAAILALKNECNQTQLTLVWGREETQRFFDTLHLQPNNIPLLIQQYKLLAPYLKKIAPDIHDCFLEDYNDENPESAIEVFLLNDLTALQHRLTHYFVKAQATETLRLQQCDALIGTIDKQAELTVFPYNVFEGFDILLQRVGNHTDIKSTSFQKTLPKNRFVLLLNVDNTYHTWGNDGVQFVLKTIPFQLIPKNIMARFKLLAASETLSTHLPYHSQFSEFYSHISTLRSHIQYASPLHCSETSVFQDSQSLSQLMMTPIDWANSKVLSKPVQLRNTQFFQEKRRLTPSEINAHDQHNVLIANPNALSLEEAWAIYHLYENKINEFRYAHQAFTELQKLIDKHFPNDPDVLKFKSKALQQTCRRLYQYIQPYLNELPGFLYFDRDFIHALYCTDDTELEDILTKREFREHLASFSFDKPEYHTRLRYWAQRALTLLNIAKTTYIQTHHLHTLEIEMAVDNDRAGFIIQSRQLSTFITSIKKSLFYWIPIFNTHIRDILKPARQGIPYPVIPLHANVSPYIRFCIRLVNTVYHLEQIALTIESLEIVDEQSDSDVIKNRNIDKMKDIVWFNHIVPLQTLGPELYYDPDIRSLLSTIYTKSVTLVSKGATLIRPYITDINTIQPLDKTAKFPALWRVMNALYLIPDNIQSLTGERTWDTGHTLRLMQAPIESTVGIPTQKRLTLIQHGNDYHIYGKSRYGSWQLRQLKGKSIQKLVAFHIDFTQPTLTYDAKYQSLYVHLVQKGYHVTRFHKAQMEAKEATLLIEYLIENAESYFNLLFSGWSIYRFNLEIQEKLTNITATSHNAVVDNLEVINRIHFVKFIKWLDRLEHLLNTKAGAFTRPAKKGFDSWYQGLIYPLDMPFPEKEALVCDDHTTQQRIDAEKAFRGPHITALSMLEPSLNKIQAFKQAIDAAQHPVVDLEEEEHLVEPAELAPPQPNESPATTPKSFFATVGSMAAAAGTALVSVAVNVTVSTVVKIANKLPKAAPSLPDALAERYLEDIKPLLLVFRNQFTNPEDIPTEMNRIQTVLNNFTVTDILKQVAVLESNLQQTSAQHQLAIWNSDEKIKYLEQQQTQHPSFHRNYRKSFAQHYFNEHIEQYCHPKKPFSNKAIATEYATMLRAHFSKQLEALLRKSQDTTHVDKLINKALKEEHLRFNETYKPYYEQLNKTLTAIKVFTTYLDTDTTLDEASRKHKKQLLEELQDEITSPKHSVINLESHLIARLQSIQKLTLKHKKDLLEYSKNESTTCFQWLIDCVFALLSAIGLYPAPKQQQHYDALVKASTVPKPVDGCLNCFGLFRHKSKKKSVHDDAELVFQTHTL